MMNHYLGNDETRILKRQMKNSEIKELTTKELIEKVEDERGLYARMKLNHTVSPLDNPNKLKEGRRLIAKLKTELRKRELSENQD